MIKRLWLTLTLASSIAYAAINNDWPKVKKDCDEIAHPTIASQPVWKRAIGCGIDFFTARPAHLTVKSIVPGGGFGLGPTFLADFNRDKWQNKFVATGVGSFRQFWLTQANFRATHDKFGVNNSARDRFAVNVYANARGLPRMTYYGIGPHTSTTDLVNFRERDVVAGADVFNPFSAWFGAGAKLESIWPDVGGVTEPGLRSITSAFNESTAPGLASQPNLIHYGVYAEPRRTRHKFQFDYTVGYHFYQDHNTGHYSFRRFKVDGTHIFHVAGRAEDVLTIHNRLTISGTSNGNVVPFYMQETLGGSDIDGQPTLRGFADYRFRAPDLMLIQVEYDHRVWGPIGLLGFYDTGEVATRASDLSFADMRHSFGFGFSIWAANRAWFKVYVGLGSGEGRHIYVGIPSF
jgi:hypothetical protein